LEAQLIEQLFAVVDATVKGDGEAQALSADRAPWLGSGFRCGEAREVGKANGPFDPIADSVGPTLRGRLDNPSKRVGDQRRAVSLEDTCDSGRWSRLEPLNP
jgi:hypothetical protein